MIAATCKNVSVVCLYSYFKTLPVPGEDEYEVEKIVEKRDIGGYVEYKVKWKGWEDEADQTWEPADNLAGSEQLIKEFEASEEVSDDDVKLCDECQRIFISDASLQRHMKDVHDKDRDSKDSETKTTKIVDIAKFVSSI